MFEMDCVPAMKLAADTHNTSEGNGREKNAVLPLEMDILRCSSLGILAHWE